MAAFTFGTGNARKIAGLPLYVLGGLVGLFVPRSPRLWVYGSGIGLGEGALALHDRARERLPQHRHVWMARTKAELADARARGMDAVLKDGPRGWWTTARATVIVVTHGFGDANRYAVRGGFVVQLWHGLPFKHLHLDSPSTYQVAFLPNLAAIRRLLGWAYRRAGRSISLFPVASERVKANFVSGFGVLPENVAVLGDVRDDVLLGPEAAEQAAERVNALIPRKFVGAKTILFAPTWRDGSADPTVPTAAEWDAISTWLTAHDAVLLVRNHPLGRGDFSTGAEHSQRIILIGSDVVTDLNPLLRAVHAVVTDYSSVVFDYALVGGPVVHFTPDLSDYTNTRGFYVPVEEFTGGRTHTTWDDTLAALEAVLNEGPDGPAHRQSAHIRQEFFDVVEPGASDRVIDAALARLGQGAEPPPIPVARRPVVTDVAFDPATSTLRIGGVAPSALVGARARTDAVDGRYPLLRAAWGGDEPLALPSGTYWLTLPDGSRRVEVDAPPAEIRHALFHATVQATAGCLAVEVRPPLDDGERGRRAQRKLERAYRRGRPAAEDAVFFESFRGRSVACNPRGIDRHLATTRPGTKRYWSVVDGSVEIPAGAERVIEGSVAWWHARGASRVLVVNDWLQKRWHRRPHQHVLQTWHGSTLKRLARDRPDVGLRTRIASAREGKRWDALLAQNEFSAGNLRSAYAFDGPVWVDGYPRNDALATAEDDSRRAVRDRLGIGAGLNVVLWAPTWRENRTAMVDFLDPVRLSELLGPEWIVLVRGHVSTWGAGANRSAPGVLDVTTYPDVTDLLQVTDVLVTDYSSVMFDWVVTGRPIVFFVPDLADYAQVLRGFYEDLLAEAPGPLVHTTNEVADAIRSGASPEYADRMRAWQDRFVSHDDGHAAERVIQRMIDAGWLPSHPDLKG